MPVNNKRAERQILGACMKDGAVIDIVLDQIEAEAFSDANNRTVFEAIVELHRRNEKVDFVTVGDELQKLNRLDRIAVDGVSGFDALLEMINAVLSTATIQEYIEIVLDKSDLRKIHGKAKDWAHRSGNGATSAEQLVEEIETVAMGLRRVSENEKPKTLVQLAPLAIERIGEAAKTPDGVIGFHTGFTDLDYLLSGLHPSEQVIVGGMPSMGKTALLLNIAQNTARRGNPVLFFSAEMSKRELVMRWLCSMAKVDSHKARRGRLVDHEMQRLVHVASTFSDLPIHVDDRPYMTVNYIRSMARIYTAAYGLKVLMVDYLQLLRTAERFQSRELQISHISDCLKQLSKELNISVVAAAQLSRFKDAAKRRPMLSDLRESGTIEQNADVVLFPFREHYWDEERPAIEEAEIIVAKQRNGPVGVAKVQYEGRYTLFHDYGVADEPDWQERNVNNEPKGDLF